MRCIAKCITIVSPLPVSPVVGWRASKEFVTQESGTGGKERSGKSETQTDGELNLETFSWYGTHFFQLVSKEMY